MASIRKAAQWVLDDCRDGIGWVAIWKEGRGWESERIYGVDFDEPTNTATIDDPEEQERLQDILAIDPHAIIVNGYFHNLGDPECMTRDSLADAIRWQYELQHATVANFLENIVQAAHEPAADAERITANDLDEVHKNEEPTEDEALAAWRRKERSVTLTNDQWSRLVCYLHLTTKHREGERDAWQNLAQEKNADGTPKFKNASSNAAYWQEVIDDLDAMLPKPDGMEA
jgi:hypothetical protein